MPTVSKTLLKCKPPKPRRSRAKSVLNRDEVQRFVDLLEMSRVLSSSDRRKLVAELKRGPHAFTIQSRLKKIDRPGRKKRGVISEHVRDCFREHIAEYTLALQAENPSIRKKSTIAEAILWARQRYPAFEISDSTLYEAIAKFLKVHVTPRPLDIVKAGNGKTRDEIKELMLDPNFNSDDFLSQSERQELDRDHRVARLANQGVLIGKGVADAHVQNIVDEFEELFGAVNLGHPSISTSTQRKMLYNVAFDTFLRRIEGRLEERFISIVGEV